LQHFETGCRFRVLGNQPNVDLNIAARHGGLEGLRRSMVDAAPRTPIISDAEGCIYTSPKTGNQFTPGALRDFLAILVVE
jgi:hypothetical protein